jgi:hypothetical protein
MLWAAKESELAERRQQRKLRNAIKRIDGREKLANDAKN